jgi:hypothetical protein
LGIWTSCAPFLPAARHRPGPHGIQLLKHAEAGGPAAAAVAQMLAEA